jgi:hypothetical protein
LSLLYDSRLRAVDDSGTPMPFAKLYTRDGSATSTPKATFTATTLLVSHTNPLVADDAGYFDQMFSGDGEDYYLILTASDGNPAQPYKTYEHVVGLGAASGDFIRTLADARFAITSGEVASGINGVIMEAGKPSPTDTGGRLKIRGWNGTTGEAVYFDFDAAEFLGDVSVVGDLDVAGKVTGGVPTLLASGAIGGGQGVAIALDPGYDVYDLRLTNVTVSLTCYLGVVFSYDGGLTYKIGSTDYIYLLGSTTSPASPTSLNILKLSNHTGATPAGGGSNYDVRLSCFAGKETSVLGLVSISGDTGSLTSTSTSVYPATGQTNNRAFGKPTHVQFVSSQLACVTNGLYALTGLPGF